MNRYYILVLSAILFCTLQLQSQVLCVDCFDQNEAIGISVNNLVQNGSFELNDCDPLVPDHFCPNSEAYACDIENWQCTGGGTSTYATIYTDSYTAIPDGYQAPYFGNWYCQVCSAETNDTSCYQMGECILSGIPEGYPYNFPQYGGTEGISLQQTVEGLVPGNVYALEFWAGGEDLDGYLNSGIFAVDVGFGNTFLRCKPTNPGEIGTVFVIQFAATFSSHTIKFTNWGHAEYLATELVLDNVKVYDASELPPLVPECGTYVLNSGELEDILVYQNGATGNFIIEMSFELAGYQYRLLDQTGRIILSGKLKEHKTNLDLNGACDGLYFLQIMSEAPRMHKVLKH